MAYTHPSVSVCILRAIECIYTHCTLFEGGWRRQKKRVGRGLKLSQGRHPLSLYILYATAGVGSVYAPDAGRRRLQYGPTEKIRENSVCVRTQIQRRERERERPLGTSSDCHCILIIGSKRGRWLLADNMGQ